jgi:hypothetical protein
MSRPLRFRGGASADPRHGGYVVSRFFACYAAVLAKGGRDMLHIAKTCLLAGLLVILMTGVSRASILQLDCGAPIQSSVITGNDLFETTSKLFVRVRGAVLTMTVPAGQTRCVKLRFTAGVTCRGSSGTEACFIRAVVDSDEMRPQPGGNQGLSGRLLRPTGLAYEWVKRLSEGQHVIQIQVRTLNVPENITVGINDWTMDVEVLN